MSVRDRCLRAWRTVVRAIRLFGKIEAEQRAAAFAYYALFSIIPFAALLLSVGTFFFTADEIRRALEEFVPISESEAGLIWSMAEDLQRYRGGVSVVAVGILLWTSLKFFQALVHAANRAWHTTPLPWWQTPVKNLAMIAVVASGLALGILVPALVQGIGQVLLSLEDFLLKDIPHPDFAGLVQSLSLPRYLGGGAVLFYTFTALYMLSPRRRIRFSQVWLAALLVTLALQVCQVVAVEYLPRILYFDRVYGAVGGIMLLLLWVYLSGVIIIFGACLCAAASEVARAGRRLDGAAREAADGGGSRAATPSSSENSSCSKSSP